MERTGKPAEKISQSEEEKMSQIVVSVNQVTKRFGKELIAMTLKELYEQIEQKARKTAEHRILS